MGPGERRPPKGRGPWAGHHWGGRHSPLQDRADLMLPPGSGAVRAHVLTNGICRTCVRSSARVRMKSARSSRLICVDASTPNHPTR